MKIEEEEKRVENASGFNEEETTMLCDDKSRSLALTHTHTISMSSLQSTDRKQFHNRVFSISLNEVALSFCWRSSRSTHFSIEMQSLSFSFRLLFFFLPICVWCFSLLLAFNFFYLSVHLFLSVLAFIVISFSFDRCWPFLQEQQHIISARGILIGQSRLVM